MVAVMLMGGLRCEWCVIVAGYGGGVRVGVGVVVVGFEDPRAAAARERARTHLATCMATPAGSFDRHSSGEMSPMGGSVLEPDLSSVPTSGERQCLLVLLLLLLLVVVVVVVVVIGIVVVIVTVVVVVVVVVAILIVE